MGYSPWGRKELDTTERLHFLSLSLQRRDFFPQVAFNLRREKELELY